MKTKLLTTTLFWLCVTAVAQSGQPHRKPFVTSEPMVHDPVMAYEDSTYYLFCTGIGIHNGQAIQSQALLTMCGLLMSSGGTDGGGWPIAVLPSVRMALPSVY